MAPRPNWKGYLKLSLVSCSIALYPATSTSERVSFNQINKNTGNRIRYKKVDAETEEEVESADIIKGYQVEKNVYLQVDDEELEALQIESSHTIEIDKFVPAADIDAAYFDSRCPECRKNTHPLCASHTDSAGSLPECRRAQARPRP